MAIASSPRPLALALILALACLAAAPVAAREKAQRPVQTVEQDVSAPSGAWTAGTAPSPDCTRGRRKLWQPGEGWIVKTITTCR